MKLKLVDGGFKTYTGFLGTVEFVNGESVRDVTMVESNNISALTMTHWIKDGVDIGQAKPVSVAFDPVVPKAEEKPVKKVVADPEPVKKPKYTREDLEAVADAKGLNGLRAIGNEFGVKATSITKLIEQILAKQ